MVLDKAGKSEFSSHQYATDRTFRENNENGHKFYKHYDLGVGGQRQHLSDLPFIFILDMQYSIEERGQVGLYTI